jgi:hypothetical protein
METFRKLLLSVGVKTFVEYYNVFEANKSGDSCEEIKESLRKKGVWKESSIATKASCGKRIFEMEKEIDALEYIVFTAKRVNDNVKEKATEILNDKDIDLFPLIINLL